MINLKTRPLKSSEVLKRGKVLLFLCSDGGGLFSVAVLYNVTLVGVPADCSTYWPRPNVASLVLDKTRVFYIFVKNKL